MMTVATAQHKRHYEGLWNLSVSLLPWESEKLVSDGPLNHEGLSNPKPSPATK